MADKPSRALILYGHGLAPFITPSHSHFHSLASLACCGFLALDHLSPSSSSGPEECLIRELSQLLDASREKGPQSEAQKEFPTMAERFMGMRAALVTRTPAVKCFGEKLGFTAMEFDEPRGQATDDAALELLKLLGFQDGKTLDNDYFDLVFVQIGSDVKEHGQHDIEYVNNLLGTILKVAQPGSEVGSRLHISLVISFGASVKDDPHLSLVSLNNGNKSEFSSLFPRQSYTLKGVKLRDGVRHHCPMLIAQWQDAVTRRDMVEEFSFSEFRKHSGNLAIPADRFLSEVAFKLWKAPKYGA